MKTALSVILFCCATAPLDALCRAMTLDEHLAGSRVVVVGRAIEQSVDTPVDPMTGKPLTPWYTLTTFVVEEMWKGSPQKTVTIRNCGASNGQWGFSCDDGQFTFHVGTRYLIFATGEPLETSACQPIGPVGPMESRPTRDALQWLAANRPLIGR